MTLIPGNEHPDSGDENAFSAHEASRADREKARANREKNRAPLSSDEMREATAVLAPKTDDRPKINWRVFIISAVVIVAFSLWAIFAPQHAETTLSTVVVWIGENLGWWYVLTITAVIAFVIWVAVSKEGRVRLGPDHSRPQTSCLRGWRCCSPRVSASTRCSTR